MPRNRRPRDREEKSAEIVEAAAALFAEVGFEKTSMAAVARGAGVTTTTIYWYFQDKEALLVAVLDHLLAGMLEGLEAQADHSWTDRLLWVVEGLQEHSKLVTAVHALSATSATVATWHSAFHELTDALLAEEIGRPGSRRRRSRRWRASGSSPSRGCSCTPCRARSSARCSSCCPPGAERGRAHRRAAVMQAFDVPPSTPRSTA